MAASPSRLFKAMADRPMAPIHSCAWIRGVILDRHRQDALDQHSSHGRVCRGRGEAGTLEPFYSDARPRSWSSIARGEFRLRTMWTRSCSIPRLRTTLPASDEGLVIASMRSVPGFTRVMGYQDPFVTATNFLRQRRKGCRPISPGGPGRPELCPAHKRRPADRAGSCHFYRAFERASAWPFRPVPGSLPYAAGACAVSPFRQFTLSPRTAIDYEQKRRITAPQRRTSGHFYRRHHSGRQDGGQ